MPRQFLIILSLLIVVTIGAFVALKSRRLREEPQTLHKLVPFELTNSNKEKVSLETLKGKTWVANFIFTSCPDFCPALTRQMRLIQKHTDGGKIRYVSFSVDPETDTPEVLAEYANKYGANTETWHFLTGAEKDIQRVMVEGFKLGFADDPVYHSDRFVLVDRDGNVRGYYSHKDPRDMKALKTDLELLDNNNAN